MILRFCPRFVFSKGFGSSKANLVLANFEAKNRGGRKEFCECTRQDQKQDGESDNEGNDDDDDSNDCYVGDIDDDDDDDVREGECTRRNQDVALPGKER